MRKANCCLALSLILAWPVSQAAEDTVPDIELLEFLGTIAGLENLGFDIDGMLDAPADDAVTTITNDDAKG